MIYLTAYGLTSWKVNTTEHIWWWVFIGSGNDFVSSGHKTLSEPMLTTIYVAMASLDDNVLIYQLRVDHTMCNLKKPRYIVSDFVLEFMCNYI